MDFILEFKLDYSRWCWFVVQHLSGAMAMLTTTGEVISTSAAAVAAAVQVSHPRVPTAIETSGQSSGELRGKWTEAIELWMVLYEQSPTYLPRHAFWQMVNVYKHYVVLSFLRLNIQLSTTLTIFPHSSRKDQQITISPKPCKTNKLVSYRMFLFTSKKVELPIHIQVSHSQTCLLILLNTSLIWTNGLGIGIGVYVEVGLLNITNVFCCIK